MSSPPPSTTRPCSESPRRRGSSSISPTTRRPSPGSRRMSRNIGGARLSGAIEEDPFVPVLRRLGLAAVEREESALEPQHAEAQERQDRPDHRDESWDHVALAHDAGDDDDREGGGAGQEQPARLLHARVLPHLPVEAEGRVRQQMDRKDDHDEDAESAPVRRRHRAVEPHDEQREIDADDDHSVQHDQWKVTPEDGDEVGGDAAATRGAAGSSEDPPWGTQN